MNLLRRPKQCILLLHRVATLQQSSLYSTSTSSRTSTAKWTNQKGESHSSEGTRAPSSSFEMAWEKATSPAFQREEEEEMEMALREKDWPRPSEIPWQSKVANVVNLIGHVEIPVQFQAGPGGKSWAGTIISQHDDGSVTNSSDSPPFWIPVIFEGDLAHVAASHLKVKDHVYIAGQLTADPPPVSISRGQANVQVMVHDFSFIEGSSQVKQSTAAHKRNEPTSHNPASKMPVHDRDSSFWADLLKNPKQWWDNRERKLSGLVKPKYPDFTHKDNRHGLWLNSAPSWVVSELDGVEFDVQLRNVKQSKEGKDEDSWKDLVENPDKWWDNRLDKLKERSPDFKHKDTGKALWLSNSPAWVLPRLPPSRSEETITLVDKSKMPLRTMIGN